jgi:hypothetical protein
MGGAGTDRFGVDAMSSRADIRPTPWTGRDALLALLVFFVPLAFYYATASRTITHGDSALNVDAIEKLTISTHVNNHNLSILLGWLLAHSGSGSLAFRAVLQAVVFGGLAAGTFALLVRRLHGSWTTAAVAGLVLMVSHSLWWHATVVETATANALLMVCALWATSRYRETGRDGPILWMMFLSGIGVFQHTQLGVIGLATLLLTAAHVRRRARGGAGRALGAFALRAAAVCTLALAPYAATLLLRDAPAAGSVSGALHAAAGGQFQKFMFQGSTWAGLRDEAYLVAMQFPSPFLVLIVPGFALFLRRWGLSAATLAVLAMCFVNAWFFVYFSTWDRFEFLLVTFVILAFWGSFALNAVVRWVSARGRAARGAFAALAAASVATPPALYANLARWGERPGSFWYGRYNNVYSENVYDSASLVSNPNKRRFRGAEAYAAALFAKLPRGATYIDDDSRTYYQVEYVRRTRGERPDLRIHLVNSWGIENWGADRASFHALLETAYRASKSLFLVSTKHPYTGLLQGAPRAYTFEPFALDGERWVYRLVTAREDSASGGPAAAAYRPLARKTETGLALNSQDPRVASDFRGADAIMARFSFVENPKPFPVSFRWFSPANEEYFASAPFMVPPGNRDVWTYLEKTGALAAGTWRVEVSSGADILGAAEFSVR